MNKSEKNTTEKRQQFSSFFFHFQEIERSIFEYIRIFSLRFKQILHGSARGFQFFFILVEIDIGQCLHGAEIK